MDVDLPPVIAVRRFLREQRARRDAFRSWCDDNFQQKWRDAGRVKPSGSTLYAFANEFGRALAEADAINIEHQGTLGRLKLKAEVAAYKIQGHVLWPINLGQNGLGAEPVYAEEAAMIVEARAHVSSKKVTVSEAPLCLGWTRHALERLCERGSGPAELDNVADTSTREVGRKLATALVNGLFKPDAGIGNANTVWLPYQGGLLVVTDRYLTANAKQPEIGWRFDYRSGRYAAGNIRSDFMLPYVSHATYRGPQIVLAAVWLATTFIGADMLRLAQRRYVEIFESAMHALGEDEAQRLFRIRFDPGHRLNEVAREPFAASEKAASLMCKARTLLAGGDFNALQRSLGTLILNEKATTRSFQSNLQDR